jgi:hypothetical protein
MIVAAKGFDTLLQPAGPPLNLGVHGSFGSLAKFFHVIVSAVTFAEGYTLSSLITAAMVLVSAGLVVFLYVGAIAAVLVLLLQALTTWSFGWTGFFTGFLVELAIEPLPFGTHSLTHIDWSEGADRLEGIVHSWTYAHPLAVKHLQEWVRSALRVDVA